jgi:hypothetical protein
MGKARKNSNKVVHVIPEATTSFSDDVSAPSDSRGTSTEDDGLPAENDSSRSVWKDVLTGDWNVPLLPVALVCLILGFGLGMVKTLPSSDNSWQSSDEYYSRLSPWQRLWHHWTRSSEDIENAHNCQHARIFSKLRESIVHEHGGYIHPDLGFLIPAPSGASRGLGMVGDTYHACQHVCLSGLTRQELEMCQGWRDEHATSQPLSDDKHVHTSQDVLVRVPYSFQITRSVAMNTLQQAIPNRVREQSGFEDLDDFAILTLFLAHERGMGASSVWMSYIESLPSRPSCGYSMEMRPYILDTILALRHELGVDTKGWEIELVNAGRYADKVVETLHWNYGDYLQYPQHVLPLENMKWALCQVASRATVGNRELGFLRLIPVIDLINHDAKSGKLFEVYDTNSSSAEGILDAEEDERGTFVVRSFRHGRRRRLKLRQELLVNYNVPQYTPLDWLVQSGFVPPEGWTQWQRLEPTLPRMRNDGDFKDTAPFFQLLHNEITAIEDRLREMEL